MIHTLFSPCRTYRYTLVRKWTGLSPSPRYVNFILLNPSTADETQDDPTIRRCIGFAKREGYLAMVVTNLFAYRATNPKELLAATDPIGPDNGRILLEVAGLADLVVLGWGSHGQHQQRSECVIDGLMRAGLRPWAFGFTKSGEPKHPLYLSASAKLVPVEKRLQ